MRQILMLISIIALLGGCATTYGPIGFDGGYTDEKKFDGTIYVQFAANGFTDGGRARDFLFYRCAEITLETGNFFFVVQDENNVAVSDRGFAKPMTNALIKVYPTTPTVPEGVTIYDAQQVVTTLRASYPEDLPQKVEPKAANAEQDTSTPVQQGGKGQWKSP